MTAILHTNPAAILLGPITAVDLQRRAVELASHLSSLQNFLWATQYLATCSRLSFSDFRRHSRKIIRLTEIARTTLIGAGVDVHRFTSCPASFAPYKSAYFEILFVLRERRGDFGSEVTDRLNRLLFPLSTRMVILKRGEHPPHFGTYSRAMHLARARPASVQSGASGSTPPGNNQISTTSMPPPNAFPIRARKNTELINRNPSRRPRSIGIIPPASPPPPDRLSTPSPEREQENIFPPEFIRRPFRRRFGIFCTGKNSMYECRERDGRSVRA